MIGRHFEIIRTPISLDKEFFDRLKALIEFAREETFRHVASQNGVEFSLVKRIAGGEMITSPSIMEGNDPAPLLEGLLHETVRRDLRSSDRLDFKLKYAGTKEVRANSIDECVEVLKDEFGVCQCFMMDFGATSVVSIDLDLDTRLNKSTYDIRAERVFSDSLAAKTRELLLESAPPMRLLHLSLLDALVPLLTALSAAWLFLWLCWKFQKSLSLTFPQIVPVTAFPCFFALIFLSGPVLRQYRKTFPFIQFEFGNQKKRRDASKTATGFLLSVLIAPIVLSLFGF